MRSRRRTAGLCAAAVVVLTGCSLGSVAASGPFGDVERPQEDERPAAFITIPVNVRNLTESAASIVSVDGRRRRRLGTVEPTGQRVFEARIGFYGDLRFQIILRGGGRCESEGALGLTVGRSIDLVVQPGVAPSPGEAAQCICQMTVV